MGLRKSLTPKSRPKGPFFKEWHLIIWRMYCFLWYKNHTTFFRCSFQTSTENTDVCYSHLPGSVSCDKLNINTITTLRCTISWGWLTRWISFSHDKSWIMGTGSNTYEITKTILHYCSCTNYTELYHWSIYPHKHKTFHTTGISTGAYLNLCSRKREQCVTNSLAPTVHTSLRVEYINHHTNPLPFPLHPNTDTWCTSTSL